jgi:hypothetical protein
MSEREERREGLARMAVELRGQQSRSKQDVNREIVEALHPPEPEPKSDADAEREQEEFTRRLVAPKPSHSELVRRVHPKEL